MSDLLHFLDQIWLARYVILKGLGLTVSISALAIAAGSVLGILVGLSLTYGNILLRSVVRIYTDFVRGTPVLAVRQRTLVPISILWLPTPLEPFSY